MTKPDPKTKLILEMLKTMADLRWHATARIDLDWWYRFYKRKASRLGIKTKEKV